MKERPELDEEDAQLLARVDPIRLRATVDDLSAIPTRFAWSAQNAVATQWLREELGRLHPGAVALHAYEHEGHAGTNVVCTQRGASPAEVVLCAHYDSYTLQSDFHPDAPAPGANDNATGVAVVLELARLLSGRQLPCTIRYLFTSGEEVGLQGAIAYSRLATSRRDDVRVVINLDMVGSPPPASPLLVAIEHDRGGLHSGNDAASQRYADLMSGAATRYAGLAPTRQLLHNSDHVAFEAMGFAAIGAYDTSFKRDLCHSVRDTIEHVDFEYLTRVTRMTLATVLLAARDIAHPFTLTKEQHMAANPPNHAAWNTILKTIFGEDTHEQLKAIRALAASYRAFGDPTTREKLVDALKAANGGVDPWAEYPEVQEDQLQALGLACWDHRTNRILAPWDTANDPEPTDPNGTKSAMGGVGMLQIW